jgi:cobalt/nickel transport system permease protein
MHTGVLGSTAKFLSVFAVTQIPLAVIEGLLGIVVLRVLINVAKPELTRLGVLGGKRKESADA